MAWYINATPTENGSYGNPQSNGREDMYILPDELLSDYISTMGFARLFVNDAGEIIEVARNDETYNAYIAEHPPSPEPEPVEEPVTMDELLNILMGVSDNDAEAVS